MKEVLAIVRLNMMNQTKRALSEVGFSAMTATNALGRGKGLVDVELLKGAERGFEEAISQLGQSGRLIPKRLLLMVLPDKLVDQAVKTIIKVNRTGKSGDGKIYVLPAADSIKVRTGEQGDAVLDDF